MRILFGIIVGVVVVAALVWLVMRSRGAAERDPSIPIERPGRSAQDAAPMTGLESALDSAVDREGRPMRARIDTEAEAVDDLRVPDDTGPLLRRALDHVSGDPVTGTAGDSAAASALDDGDDEAGDASTPA